MTAPAAALIQRQNLLLEPSRAASATAQNAHRTAQNARPAASFAAHLERGTPHHPAERHHVQPAVHDDIRSQRSAPARPAVARDRPPAEPANTAASGKTLQDKRQQSAHAASGVVRNRLEVQHRASTKEACSPDDVQDALPTAVETAGNGISALALLLAAPTPQIAAALATAPQQTGQSATGQSAAAQAAQGQTTQGQTTPVQATPSQTPALTSAAAAALAAPVAAFVLEGDGPVTDAPEAPAANALSGAAHSSAAQAAARAEPSTLASLTGAASPARSALLKAQAEAETAFTGTPAASTDTSAAALALAQPGAGPVPGSGDAFGPAAAARPAEGIGFDALVDSIARARDGAADGASVAVAMRHAEFGRVSLRFQTDADGMSVAMTSPDPAFAPAVAAAHAAEAASASGSGSDLAGSQTQSSLAQGGARSGAGQQRESQPQQHISGESSSAAPRSGEAPAGDRSGGIFA